MIDHLTQHLLIMFCKHLLSELVQNRAATRPREIFAKVPRNNDYANGYRTVTNSTLVTAVDHVAGLITSTFGPSKDFQRIAYLGLHDLRYTIVVLAGIKTGYTMFLPSPRNSEEAHAALLSSLECSKLITTYPAPVGVAFVQSMTSDKLIIPTLDELLDLNPERVRAVTYQRSFEDAKTDPIFILHTSGSTGIPKPLIYTNEYVSRIYNTQDLVPPVGFDSVNEKLRKGSCLVMLPPFHIAGLAFTLLLPALNGNIPVYPAAGAPPGLDVLLGTLAVTQVDWAFLSPAVVDEISKDPVILKSVASKLKYLFYTGGSVPKASGTAIARKMDLYQVLGSSECAAFPLLRHQNGDRTEDWQYICVHPKAKVEFRHRYDDCREIVQTRDVSAEGERYQPVFCHFSTLEEYETKDLFTEHPTLPETYIHVGRTDDIIVFSNGEKTNPVSFQDEVARHPEIRAALVVGQQRQEAALLVEPMDRQVLSEKAKQELVERIWPTVKECNSRCPRHAKVSKTKILIATASVSFSRAGKGTVQRESTLANFKKRIDSLYDEDNEKDISWVPDAPVQPLAVEDVVAAVSRLVRLKCNVSSSTSDFFAGGMDSLQAMQLRRELREEFPGIPITVRTIYANATIHTLANSIVEASHGNTAGDLRADDFGSTLQLYLSKIDALREGEPASLEQLTCDRIEEPTFGLRNRSGLNMSKLPAEKAILLTGSTGALGSHLLNNLLERGEYMIYCLNRSPDSQNLQVSRNKTRGLPIMFPEGRVKGCVKFLTGDSALPQFGLNDEDFRELHGTVTHIMHNAWPVDFNKSLRSFAGCLDGVVGLIRFAHSSRSQVTLQLVSSIAAVASSYKQSVIVEEALTSAQVPVSMGYGQSKHLAERLLTHASRELGIKTVAARVGQISGDSSRKRGWNRREWFPSLVVSSLHIRALPRTLGCAEDGKVKWVPVDSTAKILLELAAVPAHSGRNDTFHVEHPRPTAWEELFPVILGALDKTTSERGGPQMEVLDYREWFKRLEATFSVDSTGTEDLFANPAVKLLPFFESLLSKEGVTAIFDVSRSITSSSTMQSLEPVTSDCLEAWVNGWIHGDEI
jgi:thioester reductase-like protein/acyl-coenzyme A synthetase/AMP-(fatty) acid ligase/aryl carrier-like protein